MAYTGLTFMCPGFNRRPFICVLETEEQCVVVWNQPLGHVTASFLRPRVFILFHHVGGDSESF